MPDIHEYAQMSGGKIVAQGLRDANLDRGWLLAKPTWKEAKSKVG